MNKKLETFATPLRGFPERASAIDKAIVNKTGVNQ